MLVFSELRPKQQGYISLGRPMQGCYRAFCTAEDMSLVVIAMFAYNSTTSYATMPVSKSTWCTCDYDFTQTLIRYYLPFSLHSLPPVFVRSNTAGPDRFCMQDRRKDIFGMYGL